MLFDAGAHPLRELAGRQFGGVDLLDDQLAGILAALRDRCPRPLRALEQQAQLLVEDEQRRAFAALDRLHATKLSVSSDLPVPAGPRISVLDPRSMPPPSSLSSSAELLGSASRLNSRLCSAETSRGNTVTPPVLMIEVVDSRRGSAGRDI